MRRMVAAPRHYWHWFCLLAVVFCFVVIQMDQFDPGSLTTVASPVSTPVAAKSTTLSSRSNTAPREFKCDPASNSTIPSYLPEAHKDFIRYKHCREFPVLLSPTPCEEDVHLLLVIKSTAMQIERRAALRETWGQAGFVQGRRVKLLFLMGRSKEDVRGYNIEPMLQWENRRHGDILQWDFLDSFFNLTLKELGFLDWYSESCRSAQFVFKGDDDVFVNTHNLLEFLSGHSPNEHLFTGDIIPIAWPIRNRNRKYFIPVEMFPNGKAYPAYAGGGGYLMSRKTVLGLKEAAKDIELFPIDDVYTGFCLKKMGVKPRLHPGFRTFGFSHGFKHFDPCIYRDIMLVHKLNPVEMWTMWALVNDQNFICK
ncbi:N-acetyllactosaminide beta-1,3-N-acetylglucosaminyltransferase 4-like [Engraulis encrasicolus]|uniref:N-acetyllactosaminide beta-1,3-N-acetylglucosaminyltransferase 4-like n=1 Tax=Engraulis encrasicolus TaxID=184585 RepID=UPI002FD3C75F